MCQVNNHEFYENLTPESTVEVMKALLNGTAKVGPQNGQKAAEGPQGKTTLKGYTDSFPKFNLERIETKMAEMKAAAAVPPTTAAAAPAPPKVEAPKAPAAAAPKVEEKKVEAKKVEAPKAEEKKAEAPKAEEKKTAAKKA